MIELPATPFSKAIERIFEKISKGLPDRLHKPIRAVLVGGAAVHVYTRMRVSDDVEAIFDQRILLPQDLMVVYTGKDGRRRTLSYDYNYFSEIGLLHPDAEQNAWPLHHRIGGNIDLHVLSPVDLAVAKTARFQDNDRGDIAAMADAGLLNEAEYVERAKDALAYYIGRTFWVERNIEDAAALMRDKSSDDDRHRLE